MSNKQKKGNFMNWSRKSDDGNLLYQKMLNKEINLKAKPKAVLETMGWVGKYKPDSFRGAFNRIRDEIQDSCTLCPKNTSASRGNKSG